MEWFDYFRAQFSVNAYLSFVHAKLIPITAYKPNATGITYINIGTGGEKGQPAFKEEQIYSLRRGTTVEHALQMKQLGIQFLLDFASQTAGDTEVMSHHIFIFIHIFVISPSTPY